MNKAKKPTRKQIIAELRSLDCTRIHRIAAKCGVDANKEYDMREFCSNYTPSAKLYNRVKVIISTRGLDRFAMSYVKYGEPTIKRICREMREQIKWGYSTYSKILIEGNESIYWASPIHLHKDYNKSRAMPNNERNRKIMNLVNTHLSKHGIK